ncbi:endopeptidase [[Actinobacillus] muris]|uniref:Endopeptidase n=1 Tax=Muribacter muris TaxID=67855 RepID=A0A0J5P6V4_9PAST|nr:NlpC/P60 family protein [Muribacter muris]KMK51500.1 endopeptidase [[Actinobacillus] muris] [Muribacter muris]
MRIWKKSTAVGLIAITSVFLTACSGTPPAEKAKPTQVSKIYGKRTGSLHDPIIAISSLSEHQREWKGTRYRLGGTSRKGVDCSGFMQITFRDLFGIALPRTTTEQAQAGRKVAKVELQTGDLVFFKTGRGPNGKHVGVYVKNGQFLHASTKGGVIYSDIHSPYWSKTFWQARRL